MRNGDDWDGRDTAGRVPESQLIYGDIRGIDIAVVFAIVVAVITLMWLSR